MWGHLAPLVLLLLKGCQTHTVHDTVQAWEKYQADCERRMRTEPPMSGETPNYTGVFCNRTFDWYVCWGDATANTTHAEPCPSYLPWYSQVKNGFVYQRCGPDGQWVLDETDKPWRDNSQCENADPEQENSERQSLILFTLRVMYSVGYCVSVTALIVAVLILTQLRRLRCTRNLIHCNLFVSFILRGVSVLTRDALLFKEKSMLQAETDFINLSREKTMVGCRVAHIISLYFLAANYYWLLVEGLYLHNLLIVVSFSEEGVLSRYLLLGWGVPILFVVPWVVVRQLYENTQCWERNDNSAHFWIIRSPIVLAILINFLIFLRILRILVLKLRANQMRRSDRKYRLAKSTLTLIPLLGIHEAAFNLIPEESAKGGFRYSKLAAELLLSSFQGLLVAILYCFCNKEVQSELRRKRQNSLNGSRPSCAPRAMHPSPRRPHGAEDLMSDSSVARTSQY